MTISENYTTIFSDDLRKINDKTAYSTFFESYKDKKINLPSKFYPEQEFLDFHRTVIFEHWKK